MIEVHRASIEYLEFLLDGRKYARVRSILSDPFAFKGRLFTNRNEDGLRQDLIRIRESISDEPSLKRLFDLQLITHSMLFVRNHAHEWFNIWIKENLNPVSHLPWAPWDELSNGNWTSVPVLLVQNEARVVYFITGWITGNTTGHLWPDWSDALLDGETKSAVKASSLAAQSCFAPAKQRAFCCYPLVQRGETVQVRGTSLGLSLALGFLSAARGEPLPKHLVASGGIAPGGAVENVESLEQKASCAERRGFKALLYPSCQAPPKGFPLLDFLPVADLAEAWMFAQLNSPGKSGELVLFSRMLQDPKVFVNNADLVEPQWLEWVRREGKHEQSLGSVIEEPKQFSLFVDKVGWALRKWDLDRATAMASLLPSAGLAPAAERSPLAALRFCTHAMALSNHRGDVAGADRWAEEGRLIFDRALKADMNVCADFLNHRFIADHNRYRFSQDFPDELRSVLRCLEKRYLAQCEGGCFADKSLGELYGSIAQSFGFCGPNHLLECEAYARKAMASFGDGEIPEMRDDCLRQLNYLAYGEMDAGLFERAEKTTLAYLEINDWDGLWAVLNHGTPWQHALVARFLAETAATDLHGQYMTRTYEKRSVLMKPDHPWQLWAFNAGRISQKLADLEKARAFYVESLGLCMAEKLGPTVHVMALLPLSGLLAIGRLSAVNLDGAKTRVMDSAETINSEYFKVLWEKDFDSILQTVWESPEKLFPFSYR